MTRNNIYRVWSLAVICLMCLSNLFPLFELVGEANASWKVAAGLDSENLYHKVWSNKTDPNSTLREEPRSLLVTPSHLDLDSDNRSEIVVGDGKGWIYVYENNGTDNNYTEVYSNNTQGNTVYAVATADLNRDGKGEIIVGGDNKQIRIYQWDGVNGSDNLTLANSTNVAGVIRDLAISDLDFDGQDELVIGGDKGLSIYSLNATFHFKKEFTYNTTKPIYSIAIGDLDGNVAPEVAAAEANYSSLHLIISNQQNSYASALNNPLQLTPSAQTRKPLSLTVNDINGDGRSELFSGDDKGDIKIITTPNSLANVTYSDLDNLGNATIWDIHIGDSDGDQKPDLYVASSFNDSVYDYEYLGGNVTLLNSYNRTRISGPLRQTNNPAPSAIASGDPDGDGRGDVIVGCFGQSNDSMLFVLERDILDKDLEVSEINFPTDGETIPTGLHVINATVRNVGMKNPKFDVNCTILNSTFHSVHTSSVENVTISSGKSAYVLFDSPEWMANIQDTYYVNVSIYLKDDENPLNDHRNVTVKVKNIYDLAVTDMNVSGTEPYGQGENITVSANVSNIGNQPANSIPVHLRITGTNYSYNDTDQTVSLDAGGFKAFNFTPDWAPSSEGNFTLNVTVKWAMDNYTSNNYTSMEIRVKNIIDVSAGINNVSSPYTLTDPRNGRKIFNTNVTAPVNATFMNLGNKKETFNVTLNITDDNDNSVLLNRTNLTLKKGAVAYVLYKGWNTGNKSYANYTINVSVDLPTENQPTDNNHSLEEVLVWDKYDLSATDQRLNRSTTMNTNVSTLINATISNIGNMNVTSYGVDLKIVNGTGHVVHSDTKDLNTLLNRSKNQTVNFRFVTPLTEGDYVVNISANHSKDGDEANDHYLKNIKIDDYHDIGLGSPNHTGRRVKGYVPVGEHDINATARNLGERIESFNVRTRVGRSNRTLHTVMTDDMENGTGEWKHLSFRGEDLWHVPVNGSSYQDTHGGEASWWFGDEDTGNYGVDFKALLFRTVDLRNSFYATISFWVNHSLENGADRLLFVVNTDNTLDPLNASWTEWRGNYTGSSNGWVRRTINISEFAGKSIQIGFSVTGDSVPGEYRGVYLDDVKLEGVKTNFTYENNLSVSLSPDQTLNITYRYNFTKEDLYMIVFEIRLKRDEKDGNDIVTRRVDVLNYHDTGLTEVVLVSPYKEETKYSYDFEGEKDEGWTHGGVNDDWQRGFPSEGPEKAHSGFSVWGTRVMGQYSSNAECWLKPPVFKKISWGSKVEFFVWYSLGNTMTDEVRLQASGNGVDWSTLKTYTGESKQWKKETIRLTEVYGEVTVRFLLKTDATLESSGFYLDDLSVSTKYPYHSYENSAFNVTLHNFGNVPETDPQVLIGVENEDNKTYSFARRLTVRTTVLPGAEHIFTWSYQPPENGTFHIEFISALPVDYIGSNNKSEGIVEVWNFTDPQVRSILSPNMYQAVRLGERLEVKVDIMNKGTWDWPKIPVNFTLFRKKGERFELLKSDISFVSLVRGENKTVNHTFDIPYGQGTEYNVSVRIPFDNRMDMVMANNENNRALYGLSVGKVPAVFGYVYSKFSGKPLSGVTISSSLDFVPLNATSTDMKGFYWFHLPSPGRVRVRATAEDYKLYNKIMHIEGTGSRRFDIFLTVDNILPAAEIEEAPQYVIRGDTIPVKVDFGDKDADQHHTFNISSNVSGPISTDLPLNINTTFFNITTVNLHPGKHRIYVNISDPYNTTSAHFDLIIYELEEIEKQMGNPPYIWLRGYYGGNGTFSLTDAGKNPDYAANVASSLGTLGVFAEVNVTGQGRAEWMELRFRYDVSDFPLGSYEEDLTIHIHSGGGRAGWEELPGAFLEPDRNIIGINLTDVPANALYAPLIERDETAPVVESVEPDNGTTGVDVGIDYRIYFSEFIDDATVNAGINVTDGKGEHIPFDHSIEVDPDNGTSVVILNITGTLGYLKTYRVRVLRNLSDLAGNRMINTTFFTFTTVKTPVTTGRARIMVKNATGSPLKSFLVTIGDKSYLTNTAGTVYSELVPGSYLVEVLGREYEGKEYGSWSGTAEIELNRTTTMVAVLEVEIPPPVWGILTGNVSDDRGLSVPEAEIVIRSSTLIEVGNNTTMLEGFDDYVWANNTTVRVFEEYLVTTADISGGYRVKLDKGGYNITFKAPSYHSVRRDVNVTGAGKLTWLNVTMKERSIYGRILFSVVDSAGRALTDVEVSLKPIAEGSEREYEVNFSEASGRYESVPVPEGVYELRLSREGHQNNESIIWITEGPKDMGNFTLWTLSEIYPEVKPNELNTYVQVALGISFVILVALIIYLVIALRKKGEGEEKAEEEKEGEAREEIEGEEEEEREEKGLPEPPGSEEKGEKEEKEEKEEEEEEEEEEEKELPELPGPEEKEEDEEKERAQIEDQKAEEKEEEEDEGDMDLGDISIDLDSLDEDISISDLDDMVSGLLGEDEDESGEAEEDEEAEGGEEEETKEDEGEEAKEDEGETEEVDLDDIDIDFGDVDMDDISIDDLEKSLDELGQ